MRRKSRRSRRSSRKKSRRSLPKTMKLPVKKSNGVKRHFTHASPDMTLTELQFMAKSRGIPFGGLTKNKLIIKINRYQ